MSRTLSLRISTAILLGAAALAFTVGTAAERSAHRDSEAAHADEHASPLITTPPTVTSPPTGAADPSTPGPVPTSASGLSAPEGSAAREVAERGEHLEPTAVPTPVPADQATATPDADADAAEGSAAREAAERGEGTHSDEAGERLFGLTTESTALVTLAGLISLALILLLLLARSGPALAVTSAATAAFAAAAAALDTRESLHQQDLGQNGLLATAAGVAALHLLCALSALALLIYRQVSDKPVHPAT